MDNPRELPRRDKVEWNSCECCSELDNGRFKRNSGQGIPSIPKIVGEGIER
jgi:hypothetical protein